AQSLGVVFGSNIGTTMTGWLVSLIGFGFKIEAMALPLLAAGVGFKLVSRNPRNQFLGEALAGFALF
ncbi:MAG TPA: Na/Pi cotransporter, partial [Marinobacter hydrocarbonoclasticus]|nr:Na/Pi cotransporter [Marinobacter nauticus]